MVLAFSTEKHNIYGTGCTLDTFLFAYELPTFYDYYETESDVQWETINQRLKDFDFKEYAIEKLNALTAEEALKAVNLKTPPILVQQSEFLPGDWLDLETNNEHLNAYIKELKETITEDAQAYNFSLIPKDLAFTIEKSLDSVSEHYLHEFLYGDRSNEGVLDQLSKKLTSESGNVEWEPKTDTITVTLNDESIRHLYSYDLSDDEEIPSEKSVSSFLLSLIIDKASDRKLKASIQQEKNHHSRLLLQQQKLSTKREKARLRKASKS